MSNAKRHIGRVLLAAGLIASSTAAFARGGGGGHSSGGGDILSAGFAFLSPDQSDLNAFVDAQGVVGTKELSSAYEFFIEYESRFSGTMFALAFRPSYFTETASGGGVSAGVSGFTFFPIFRIYPLENDYFHLYFNVGVGYGQALVSLGSNGASGSYTGNTFGALAGLGVAICFTASSCVSVEGNARYLPIKPVTGSG
ncbi:MAG: hypothetical protein C5B49_05440, partial [Bdellovibrio sp.]